MNQWPTHSTPRVSFVRCTTLRGASASRSLQFSSRMPCCQTVTHAPAPTPTPPLRSPCLHPLIGKRAVNDDMNACILCTRVEFAAPVYAHGELHAKAVNLTTNNETPLCVATTDLTWRPRAYGLSHLAPPGKGRPSWSLGPPFPQSLSLSRRASACGTHAHTH